MEFRELLKAPGPVILDGGMGTMLQAKGLALGEHPELAALEQAGKIRDLRMQVDFTLQEAYTDGEGRRARAIRYRADFSYMRVKETIGEYTFRDQLVVEDVKSRATRTKEYIMKRKLMKERFNIDIQEV